MKKIFATLSFLISASALAQTPPAQPQAPTFDNTKMCLHDGRFYGEDDEIKGPDGTPLQCRKKSWGDPQTRAELHWDRPSL